MHLNYKVAENTALKSQSNRLRNVLQRVSKYLNKEALVDNSNSQKYTANHELPINVIFKFF